LIDNIIDFNKNTTCFIKKSLECTKITQNKAKTSPDTVSLPKKRHI